MLLLRDVIYYLSVCLYIYTEAKSDDDLIFNKLKKQSQFFSSQVKLTVSRHNSSDFSCSFAINVSAHLIADKSLFVVISA